MAPPGVFISARHSPALILALLALAYAVALAGPFQFDDYNVIVDNPAVHSLAAWWHSLPGLRMGLKLSYALDWSLSADAFGFHLTNVLLHLLNATLLWYWLREFLPPTPARQRIVSVTVLLWGLHPVQTEAVTYIAGRSMSLMATFYLATLLVQARQRPGAGWQSAALALLALLTRETAWTLPAALLLTGHLQGGSWRRTCQRAAPALAVTLVAALFFLLEPHYSRMLAFSLSLRDLPTQLLTQLSAWHYLLGTALFGLAPDIDPDLPVQYALTPSLLAVAGGLLALALAGIRLWWQRRPAGFALLWCLLQLLPTNSIFPRLDVANDHHLYLALAGPALLVALMLAPLARVRLATALLAGLLFGATLLRNLDYRSELALWSRTAVQSPGKARVWNNLGQAAQQAGDITLARAAYRRATVLAPHDSRARLNLYFLERDHPGSG